MTQACLQCGAKSASAPVSGPSTSTAARWGPQVQPGDLIIAASDGLWDNAKDEEILRALSPTATQPERVGSHYFIRRLIIWTSLKRIVNRVPLFIFRELLKQARAQTLPGCASICIRKLEGHCAPSSRGHLLRRRRKRLRGWRGAMRRTRRTRAPTPWRHCGRASICPGSTSCAAPPSPPSPAASSSASSRRVAAPPLFPGSRS